MADDATRKILIIIKLFDNQEDDRITYDFPSIKKGVDSFSIGEPLLVFRASDCYVSGYFLQTNKPLNMIRAELEKSDGSHRDDSFLILEVGEDFTGYGFSQAWTWLQHH